MREMRIESQDDAVDIVHRLRGLTKAITFLLSPAFGQPEDFEWRGAAVTCAEAILDYSGALLSAVDMPTPELMFVQSGGARAEPGDIEHDLGDA